MRGWLLAAGMTVRCRNSVGGRHWEAPAHWPERWSNMQPRDDDALLTPSEVAAMFRVNPKTVTRWARAGKISAIRTLGGHRRFRESEIRQFLEQVEQTDQI